MIAGGPIAASPIAAGSAPVLPQVTYTAYFTVTESASDTFYAVIHNKTITTSIGPRWQSYITFNDPWPGIREGGAKWASTIEQATAVQSVGPYWNSNVVTSATVSTSIHEHGPKFRLFYNIANGSGPVWRLQYQR